MNQAPFYFIGSALFYIASSIAQHNDDTTMHYWLLTIGGLLLGWAAGCLFK